MNIAELRATEDLELVLPELEKATPQEILDFFTPCDDGHNTYWCLALADGDIPQDILDVIECGLICFLQA